MYSICYVCVDDEKLDIYSEMIISICSLRKHNFHGDICVLVDNGTKQVIDKIGQNEFLKYGVKCIVAQDVPLSFTNKMKSRYIKTSIRNRIVGDILFVDTDTIFAGTLPETISEYEIALVPDVHSQVCDMSNEARKLHIDISEKCGYQLNPKLFYFNSGVIWAKDTMAVHQFYEEWHRCWCEYVDKGVVFDQPGLNRVNDLMDGIIHKLPDIYNVQVSGNPFPTSYLMDAKIIHYFHNPNSTYILVDKSIVKRGLQDPLVQNVIDDPRKAFIPGTMLPKDDIREQVIRTELYFFVKRLYVKYPHLYKTIEWTIQHLLWMKGRLCKHAK